MAWTSGEPAPRNRFAGIAFS